VDLKYYFQRGTMSATDSKDFSGEFTCPYSAGAEFDRALNKAETLAQSGNLEEALELLWHLEKKYMRASRLFDVIGEMLLQRGQMEAGVRYKTLHEILKGTFKIAVEESGSRSVGPFAGMGPAQVSPSMVGGVSAASSSAEAQSVTVATTELPEEAPEYIPMTVAMAKLLMQQGHFDKALGIYNFLISKDPKDESLLVARENIRKKKNEKKVVTMLQRWLNNIERLKTERDARP
jgi:tetratricopeptide (TPR) repeat protein